MRGIIFLFLVSFTASALASINVVGHFTASKSCPAYLSKNKKTNPKELMLQPNTRYTLHEINRTNNPDWLRIAIPDNNTTSLRWVSVQCGTADYQTEQKQFCEQNPGLADSYVIALSWQPGFCKTYGYEAGKPECLHLSPKSYQANHLVLHGLWPNQDNCGENYGFCGARPQPSHCDYTPLYLSDEVAQELKILMPGYAFGSCLERHEWNKHGSCQILSSNDYFALAMRLTNEANETELGQYLHNNVGQRVSRVKLQELVRQSFDESAAHKVYFGCKNGLLVDIYIELPALIPAKEPLKSLILKAPEFTRSERCPTSIIISDFISKS